MRFDSEGAQGSPGLLHGMRAQDRCDFESGVQPCARQDFHCLSAGEGWEFSIFSITFEPVCPRAGCPAVPRGKRN